ncbi:MAG: PQQ-binding-like beta-propeller repeat protein [Phycisphaerae bacterium]|nr:PQQ-binding-like beta-propeller repeat protein [Phycisphaerae bacterium]
MRHLHSICRTLAALSVSLALQSSIAAAGAPTDWPMLAADPARSATQTRGPWKFDQPLWNTALAFDEEFIGRSAPVVADGLVIVAARGYDGPLQIDTRLVAFDALTGNRRWTALLAADVFDSFSSPAIDTRNKTAIFGSDTTLFAVRLADGAIVWQTPLSGPIVNASPLVTSDLCNGTTPTNRVFITDFANSTTGKLYAVNVDPFDAAHNPYWPGQIVWTRTVGRLSGASPAYADGRVVVAAYEFAYSARLLAYDAYDGSPRWTRNLGPDDGFFGGVTLREGNVFAATYDFNNGQNNARLFKIRLADGVTIWTTSCERTASIPIVASDGRIFISGGIENCTSDCQSALKVQAFRDWGTSVSLLWDTSTLAGLPSLGGWAHQPALARGFLYTGAPGPLGDFKPYVEGYILDLARTPGTPGFIRDSLFGIGGSPAIDATGVLYTVGDAGLFAFAPAPIGDINCDGFITVADIAPFVLLLTAPQDFSAQYPDCDPLSADVNLDGFVSVADIGPFVALLTNTTPQTDNSSP